MLGKIGVHGNRQRAAANGVRKLVTTIHVTNGTSFATCCEKSPSLFLPVSIQASHERPRRKTTIKHLPTSIMVLRPPTFIFLSLPDFDKAGCWLSRCRSVSFCERSLISTFTTQTLMRFPLHQLQRARHSWIISLNELILSPISLILKKYLWIN